MQDKGHIIGPFAYDDLNFNDSHREMSNNQACPIAQPNRWVEIAHHHHWCAIEKSPMKTYMVK
jgi:hypothetical protein